MPAGEEEVEDCRWYRLGGEAEAEAEADGRPGVAVEAEGRREYRAARRSRAWERRELPVLPFEKLKVMPTSAPASMTRLRIWTGIFS